jgi:hypothetical protein
MATANDCPVTLHGKTAMRLNHLILITLLPLSLLACNRTQPSGVPDSSSTPQPTAPAEPASTEPQPAVAGSAPIEDAPPPLDSPIAPYAETGFPDCDDYIENYRQCLNTRLGSDERKLKAGELQDSVRSIMGNISRGVDGARVAGLCKKARRLASKKLSALGCPE